MWTYWGCSHKLGDESILQWFSNKGSKRARNATHWHSKHFVHFDTLVINQETWRYGMGWYGSRMIGTYFGIVPLIYMHTPIYIYILCMYYIYYICIYICVHTYMEYIIIRYTGNAQLFVGPFAGQNWPHMATFWNESQTPAESSRRFSPSLWQPSSPRRETWRNGARWCPRSRTLSWWT